jgi:hypothetical protein
MGVRDDGKIDRRHVESWDRKTVTDKVRKLERARDEENVTKPGLRWTIAEWIEHWLNNIAAATTSSLARVLKEWSAITRVFHRTARPSLDELGLSRALELAASALGDTEPIMRFPRDNYVVPSRQRLDAVAVLAERESRLSAVQRIALVDATASWLSEPNGGEQLAYALLSAACTAEITTEQVYLTLITPPDNTDDHSEGLPS